MKLFESGWGATYLCAEARESLLVGDVGTRCSTAATTSTTEFTTAAATTASTTATTLAPEFTPASTTAASASGLLSRLVIHTGVVELDNGLLLSLTVALLLAAGTSDKVLGFLTSDSLALGELLGGTFIGLANLEGLTKSSTLGLLLGLPGSIRLGLVLLRLDRISSTLNFVGSFSLVLLLDIDLGIASLLVGELLVASLASPAMGSLLVVLPRKIC